MASILAFIGPGGPELIVIMLVLLLMFGSKDAPRIFRKINEFINQLRTTADGFKREIMYSDIESNTSSSEDYGTDHPYEDDYHDDDYTYMDEEEADYSDETFMNLENDLDEASRAESEVTEPESVEEAPESEADDAQKA